MTTGRLSSAPVHSDRYGNTHHACVDCETMYPVLVDYDEDWNPTSAVKCNGHVITVCPWCRPDSESWKHGRGL